MSNLNYGYPSSNNTSFSSYSSQYSSTPSNSNTRFQRPRFAYAGPPSYPRPRSSASKPNPDPYVEPIRSTDYGSNLRSISSYQNTAGDSTRDYNAPGYSDSMVNNYGDSPMPLDSSLPLNNSRDSFAGSQHTTTPNPYYSANDSFYQSPQNSFSSYPNDTSQYNLSSKGGHTSFGVDSNKRPLSFYNTNVGGLATFPTSTVGPIPMDTQSGGLTGSYGKTNTRGRGGPFGSNRGNFRGRFQKKKPLGGGANQPSGMSAKWKCTTCSIDFTSQIPLEMHLRGARHAKKLKSQTALSSMQGQISQVKEIEKPDGKKFYCEPCNVIANSSLQLQMHLDGTKHKNKLNPKEESKEGAAGKKSTDAKILNGKSNGGVTRPAPAEFGEPQPSKMSKYSCDVCNIIVNSDTQLQQHLTSKKHQAKVEGKPIIKKKKIKDGDANEQPAEEAEMSDAKAEITNVVGVKTLSASFVQGGTLQ